MRSKNIPGTRPVVELNDADDAGYTVLGRAAAIIDAFDCSDEMLSLTDLSQRVNMPKATIHRYVWQLCALGWLQRYDSGYRVGMRIFELGGLVLQGERLRDVALPHMCALAARTGLAVQLGVLDVRDVVYLERVLTGRYRLPTRIGGRQPAYCTALGKAMLAFDDAAARAALSSGMLRRTEYTLNTPEALGANLDQVRAAGIAFDHGEAYSALGCVAAPIRSGGQVIGALSVTGPLTAMNWKTTAAAVQNTAEAICIR